MSFLQCDDAARRLIDFPKMIINNDFREIRRRSSLLSMRWKKLAAKDGVGRLAQSTSEVFSSSTTTSKMTDDLWIISTEEYDVNDKHPKICDEDTFSSGKCFGAVRQLQQAATGRLRLLLNWHRLLNCGLRHKTRKKADSRPRLHGFYYSAVDRSTCFHLTFFLNEKAHRTHPKKRAI
ncbi:unnamed protein product [Caenorhabditis auriculariae]|uniref:Uncharacterized protein n=1 Tax=Caenorhabditis auriculariae TaxID=2777116 RepID=A0A8S1H2P9_9PELO|nr:unnamed protein product [Caenorhabditis auriculariae]